MTDQTKQSNIGQNQQGQKGGQTRTDQGFTKRDQYSEQEGGQTNKTPQAETTDEGMEEVR
jgi:hypothetical protein